MNSHAYRCQNFFGSKPIHHQKFSWSASKIAAAEQVRSFEILTSLSAAGEDQGKPSVSFKQMALIFPS
jgi:hypothetical protein